MKNIDHLVLVAGASCVGKTFLIRKFKKGECLRLCEQLGINKPDEWDFSSLSEALCTNTTAAKIIIQYDCHNQKRRYLIPELIGKSTRTTVLTLCAPSRVLIRRNLQRQLSNILEFMKNPRKLKLKIQQTKHLWRELLGKEFRRDNLTDVYNDWFEFLNRHSVENYFLDATTGNLSNACLYAENPDRPVQIIAGGSA